MLSARLVPVDDLVTIDDIAQRFQWSLCIAIGVATGRDGRFDIKFPKPVAGKAKRGIWLWTDVESWYEQTSPRANRSHRAQRKDTTRKSQSWKHGRH